MAVYCKNEEFPPSPYSPFITPARKYLDSQVHLWQVETGTGKTQKVVPSNLIHTSA